MFQSGPLDVIIDFFRMCSIEKIVDMSKFWKTVVTTPPQSEYNKHLLQELLGFQTVYKGCSFSQCFAISFNYICLKIHVSTINSQDIKSYESGKLNTGHYQVYYRKGKYVLYKTLLASERARK